MNYFPAFGLVVNSNAGPNTFYRDMLVEFLRTDDPKRELTLKVGEDEVVFIPKPTRTKKTPKPETDTKSK